MAFVPIAFDGSTKTQYATWRANLRLLFWAQEGNESELFVALKLLNITVWNEHLLCIVKFTTSMAVNSMFKCKELNLAKFNDVIF